MHRGSQAMALANDFWLVGLDAVTPRTRTVATRSSTGVRTLAPADAANSSVSTSAVRVAEMSVPLSVNTRARWLTRASEGLSETNRTASRRATIRAVAGW